MQLSVLAGLNLSFSLIQFYVTLLLNSVHYYCKTLIPVEYFMENNNLNLPGHFHCGIIELDSQHPVSFVNVSNEIVNIDKKVLLVISERKRRIHCVREYTDQKNFEYRHFSRCNSQRQKFTKVQNKFSNAYLYLFH